MSAIKRFLPLLYIAVFSGSLLLYQTRIAHPTLADSSSLLSVKMKAVEADFTEAELREIVLKAKKAGDSLSIGGMRHSQGGQTLYPNGVLLDMRGYDRIVSLDPEAKQITVQSGITWAEIQEAINPHGLALQVSQSQNIFTVGGSLSVNAHGLDIRHGGITDQVESFRLLMADGQILHVSREEHAELFDLALGGYGLFGVILDVTLQLTDDELYRVETAAVDYQEYSAYFTENVLGNEAVGMHRARISVAPEGYFTEMVVENYLRTDNQEALVAHDALKQERLVALPKLFLGLSRWSDWGKDALWDAQEAYAAQLDGSLISRNNAMRSDAKFMEYSDPNKTEVLQEYFIPVDQYAVFIDDLRTLLAQHPDFNLLNITVRYVEETDGPMLSYANGDMFGLVMLINQGTSEAAIEENGDVIRAMVDLALEHGGSYYLPYYSFPTDEQFSRAYPEADVFFEAKTVYDPENRFLNLFYEEYGKEESP
ncbi:FAD-binding protein [Planococcus lenghuensis]|uniref:FAD-binding oxidoreductase n=1 Tax=Planococcus lenghuensis TaxID=2213202 RepID=A0A1Q2KYQ0_9BACL|nr:FAD-binding oxidoreductase [Planococcus lenghuensis]AQQ53331.1 FAD-binding oxidoreductase [Planococcus lenghuensis]